MDWAPAVTEPWTFHLRWCWKLLWGRERFPFGQPLLVMGHCSSWGQSPNSHLRGLARHLFFYRWIQESKRAQFIMCALQLCHTQTKTIFSGNFFSACSCFGVNRCRTWCLLSLGLAMRPIMCQTTTTYLFKQRILLSRTQRVSFNTSGCLF